MSVSGFRASGIGVGYQQLVDINVQRFRGGLVFKVQRLVYHSTLDLSVMKQKNTSMQKESCAALSRTPPRSGFRLRASGWGFGLRLSGSEISHQEAITGHGGVVVLAPVEDVDAEREIQLFRRVEHLTDVPHLVSGSEFRFVSLFWFLKVCGIA